MGISAYGYSDEARRAADSVNLHIEMLGTAAMGKWVALRLSDGGSDGVLYDTKRDAVAHQLHEKQCAYLKIPGFAQRMSYREAESFLTLHRSMYDAGYRLQDPDDPAPIHGLISTAAPGRGARVGYPYRGLWS